MIKARALISAALAVAGLALIINTIQRQHAPGPAAFCDVRTMSCYDQLGRAR